MFGGNYSVAAATAQLSAAVELDQAAANGAQSLAARIRDFGAPRIGVTTDDTPATRRFDVLMSPKSTDVRAGDWITVHQIGGGTPRRGEVIEVLGQPGHEHYRVRWDEEHESIHFPSEGSSIERPRRARAATRRRGAPTKR